jgi:hypothetical protein
MGKLISVLIVTGLFACKHAFPQRDFSLQVSPGYVYCFNTPLYVKQSGYSDIRINARYKTESLKLPIYYSIRIGTSKNNHGWEMEMIHVKMYLQNNPPEIEQFNISHGYNILQLNRNWIWDEFLFRAGAGIVIAHPENIVRRMKFDDKSFLDKGYYFSGPCFQVSGEKRIRIYGKLYFSMEVKTTASITKIGVYNGHAIVTHIGLHGLFGLGYSLNLDNQ